MGRDGRVRSRIQTGSRRDQRLARLEPRPAGGLHERDSCAGFHHITTVTHAECVAHLLRTLKGAHDSDPASQEWAAAMVNTLLIAKKWMAEGNRPYAHLRKEFEARLHALQEAGTVPDPRRAPALSGA